MTQTERFELVTGRWYGWQMLPGYTAVPYFSPIRVERVQPCKTGGGILTLEFWNLGYASGVQDFKKDLRVRSRQRTFIFAELVEDPGSPEVRGAVITVLTPAWVRTFCWPGALEDLPADARRQLRDV